MKIYYDLINSIITSKQILPALKRVDNELIDEKEPREVLKFIKEHYAKYSIVPEKDIVIHNFPDFEYEPKFNTVSSYIDAIYKHRFNASWKRSIQKMVADVKEGTFAPEDLIKHSCMFINESKKYLGTEEASVDVSKDESYINLYRERKLGASTGLKTYIPAIDKKGTMKPGHLIYIFARTGVGKTWFTIYNLMKLHEDGFVVLFCSLEMTKEEVEDRIYCLMAKINYTDLMQGTLTEVEEQKLYAAAKEFHASKTPMYIYNPASTTVENIESEIVEVDPDMAFVDYIDLIDSSEKGLSAKEAAAKKSKALKQMARRRKIPIGIIAQSNREFAKAMMEKEMGGDDDGLYLPGTHNLANADECGRDADLIIGLSNVKDKKQLYIGTVKGRFVKKNASIVDFDPDHGIFNPIIDMEDQVRTDLNEQKETFKKYVKK
jgi:replicative DNA helicase